jgi:DNA-binding LacI/PurR family transcriptional regulator
MKSPTRLSEIAMRLGVSASTVSRALSRPELVREETRIEIVKAAKLAGYEAPDRPPSARLRTGCIGLLVPDIENPFFTTIVRAAMHEARRQGYSLIVADSNEEPLRESEILALTGQRVEGLVLASSRLLDDDLRKVEGAVPLVLINRELQGVTSLLVDDQTGVSQAVEHLAALGHRSIAYAGGPESSWSNRQRQKIFGAVTQASGVEGVTIGPYPPRFDGGVQASDVALARAVTAIIAYNDLMAFGILSRLSSRGVAVPEAMSVIGFDDIPAASNWSPSLTTITASTAFIGEAAVASLIRNLRGKRAHPESNRRLASHLVIRASTATPVRVQALAEHPPTHALAQ